MRKVALFDFCKTLVSFDTHDPFIVFVLQKEKAYLKFIFASILMWRLTNVLQRLRIVHLPRKKEMLVSLLAGIPKSSIERSADLYAEKLQKKTIDATNRDLSWLNEQDVKIYVISAGLSVYIQRYMDIHHPVVQAKVIANELDFQDGLCTGKYTSRDCIGSEKVAKYKAIKDASESVIATYSDSSSDQPIVDLAEYGYLVTRSGKIKFWNEHVFSRKRRVKQALWKSLSRTLPDASYLKYAYKKKHGRSLDLENPKLLTEHIQAFKLSRTTDLDVRASDKIEAKKLVSDLGYPELIIPTLATYSSSDEVDFEAFSDQDVIYKCNHDSQGGIIARREAIISPHAIRSHLSRRLKRSHFTLTRERPYKTVRPQILVERLILDDGKVPNDLKIHCFKGRAEFIYLSIDREGNDVRLVVDREWNKVDVFWNPEGSTAFDHEILPPIPPNLDELLKVAEDLAQNWSYCRIDLYNTAQGIFFGEITLFPHGGLEIIKPIESDVHFGTLITQ